METVEEKTQKGLEAERAEERPKGSPLNTAKSLHITLPHSDPKDFLVSICKSLLQIPPRHWEKIQQGAIDSEMYVTDFVMDLVQAISGSILTVVLPQLLKHMRTHGSVPTRDWLTGQRADRYLGDSVRRALAMSFSTQTVMYPRRFNELLITAIAETVNKVLALCALTPVQDHMLPVFLVTGAACTLHNLSRMAQDGSAILRSGVSQDEYGVRAQPQSDVFESKDYCVLRYSSQHHARAFLIEYLTRLATTLRTSSHIPHRDCDSSSGCQRDICLLVGSNTQMLTVKRGSERENVLNNNCNELCAETGPFSLNMTSSATPGIGQALSAADVQAIEMIAEELADTLWATTEEELDKMYTDTALRRLTRRLTHRYYSVVLSRPRSHQVPLAPPKLFMGNMVSFICPNSNGSGPKAQSLYFKTEEIINRAAKQVLLWAAWYKGDTSLCTFFNQSQPSTPAAGGPELLPHIPQADGDYKDEDDVSDEDSEELDGAEDGENEQAGDEDGYESTDEEDESSSHEQMMVNFTKKSVTVVIVAAILRLIGIIDVRNFQFFLRKMATELDSNLLGDDYDLVVMGRSFREICPEAVRDLLESYGSVTALSQAAQEQGSTFATVLKEVIENQLTKPTGVVPPLQPSVTLQDSIAVPGEQLTTEAEHTEAESHWLFRRLWTRLRSCWNRGVHLSCCQRARSPPPTAPLNTRL